MDVSPLIKSSQSSAVSPDGMHVASLNATAIEIRVLASLQLVRSIKVPINPGHKFICLRWSPIAKATGASNRILLATDHVARIWDIQDHDWSATLDNGSAGMGKIANVEWGADDTELAVFSDFSSLVTIWSLWDGNMLAEIRDPKFVTKGFGRDRQGKDSVFALLVRNAAQDSLNLYASGSYGQLKSISLPTLDAQGLKWSPDGRWVAVWDTASSGYKVLIYTADGNLFRTYSGDYYDDALIGLGVKCVEWSPSGDFLAVTGYEDTVTLLTTRTFSPAVHLTHIAVIKLATGQVWQEQGVSSERYYSVVPQPAHPPMAATPQAATDDFLRPKIGISILGFNAEGSMMATKYDSMPTAVWIWDLSTLRCRAVLLQYSEVKRLQWHPSDPDLLLIQCAQSESILYVWSSKEQEPQVLDMGNAKVSGRAEAQWIHRTSKRRHTIALGDVHSFVLAHPPNLVNLAYYPNSSDRSSDQLSEGAGSDDSVYEYLSGKHADQKIQTKELPSTSDTASEENGFVEDTFRWRSHHGIGAH